MKKKFTGKIINKKVSFDDPYAWMSNIEFLEGQHVKITIEKSVVHKEKSLQQLGYFWGVIIEDLRNYIGYDKEQMYNAILGEFSYELDGLGMRVQKFTGLSELNTVQMEDLCSKIRTWASEFHGCYLPLPNERGFQFELR